MSFYFIIKWRYILHCLKKQTNFNDYRIWYINCRLLEPKTNKQNNTSTEKTAVKDTDEYLTTTERVTHIQKTADGKENTVTVVLIVLMLVLMVLLIIVLILYIRKTGKICYKERCQKGNIIHHISNLSLSLSLSLSVSLFLSLSLSLSRFRSIKGYYANNWWLLPILCTCTYMCIFVKDKVPTR